MDLFPAMLSKFRELASFRFVFKKELLITLLTRSRRAIKIAEKFEPETAAQFTKHMGMISSTLCE